jgi:hypothetical protein
MGATRASYGLGHVPGRGRTPTITNHLDEQSKIRYVSDIYVERQALNAAEKIVLCQHIRECYQSHLSFNVELLHYYANHLLQVRVRPLLKK